MMSNPLSNPVTRAQKPIYNLNSIKIKRKLENKSRYHYPPPPQHPPRAQEVSGGERSLRRVRVDGGRGVGVQKLEDGGMVRSVGLVERGYTFSFVWGDD